MGGEKPQTRRQPVAAVYRGPVASEGCPEALAELLRRSLVGFKVQYIGPKERRDISPDALSRVDVLAWPGGGGEQSFVEPKVVLTFI